MPEGKEILLGRTLDELTELVTSLGMPRFTGKQIAQWLYDKRVTSIDEMTNLSKANRTLLAERYTVGRTAPVMSQLSKDGTRKYLFAVSTGGLVEAVFIPDKDRATLCISSQVGCKMDCLFCMTGKQGFKGNLSSGEIINQVLSVEESASLTNVVYMGMGEPLDNATNVLKSISVLTSAWGLGWSPKRVTLSTVGVRRGLEHFLSETTCHLAVSLHNPFHEGRLELMPAEGGLPLEDTLQMIREADFTGQRRVSFEYIVFDGVNDSDEHAAELARLLRGIPCRINLIPFHQIPDVPLRPLSRDKMEHFKRQLESRGYTTSLHLLHFKSIASASCTFSPKVNCFIGLNGMGKTNLLDALHYLSFTKSHLSITDSLAVQYGQEAAVLDAVYRSDFGDERQLLLQIRPGHRKVLKRNKKEYPKLSDHIGAFPLVIVSPQDYQLILGGSDERRRFVDKQLSQQDSVYMAALAQYHRILEQRNVLLKSQRADDAVLEVLDLQLEQVSPLLYERRAAFVRDFIPLFQQYYTAISGGQDRVSLVYTSSLAEHEGHCLELLREARQRDRLMGYTTMGLHKDDLQMLLGEELIRKVGSEGQNKTFLIALKFAQYALLSATNPERPLLLLDDIFDKLDAERVERIIRLVGGSDFGQIFITDTNRKHLDEIVTSWGEDYRLFEVSSGEVCSIDSTPTDEAE